MEAYIFHHGAQPEEIIPDFEPALFNLPEFFLEKEPSGWLSFYALGKTGRAVAWLHFHVAGKVARSPAKAPFGSIECVENLNPSLLHDFLRYVETTLSEMGIREIYMKNPPRAYSPQTLSLVETFLLNLGYAVSDAEPGVTISVNSKPFTQVIRRSEMLRHKQAQRAGFSFRQIAEGQLDEVYGFILACHREKGYKISIALEDLSAAVKKFPGRYLLFGVFSDEQLLGATVSILVRKHILYNFLLNHEKRYNHLSPPVLLMEGLYNFCQANSISLLDLGTSSLHGEPNFTLLDFKMHLGGGPTSKFSFYKKIA